jgi:DNA polymerase
MFVGEGPGRSEDEAGRPFVGEAGRLLDKMLAAIGLDRKDVYIANIVKCRPPANRVPAEEEASACLPYLRAQFALIRPKVLVCLGATSAKYLYDADVRITRDRGVWRQKKGVWILPTYHPAALLRDPSKKREAWEDLKSLRQKLSEIPEEGDRKEIPYAVS